MSPHKIIGEAPDEVFEDEDARTAVLNALEKQNRRRLVMMGVAIMVVIFLVGTVLWSMQRLDARIEQQDQEIMQRDIARNEIFERLDKSDATQLCFSLTVNGLFLAELTDVDPQIISQIKDNVTQIQRRLAESGYLCEDGGSVSQ